jgi:hypothetical protein
MRTGRRALAARAALRTNRVMKSLHVKTPSWLVLLRTTNHES